MKYLDQKSTIILKQVILNKVKDKEKSKKDSGTRSQVYVRWDLICQIIILY